jgi:ATP-dependent helicase/nuclease subunit B
LKGIAQLETRQQQLTLKHLEQEFTAPLVIQVKGQNTTVFIKGTIDRIDSFGNTTRVIDYKSSVKDTDKFTFDGFEPLFHNKQFNKQLQLMVYAWLLYKNNFCNPAALQPCIIPFRAFSEEPKYILRDKQPLVFSEAFLLEFEQALKTFTESIFDETVPFSQTSDNATHEYCPYNKICNFAV